MEDLLEKRPSLRDRFWSHVDKKEPTECWEWNSKCKRSYGWFRVDMNKKRHEFIASRVALFLSGTSVKGLFALHSCDNPVCCNPNHLRAGTHKENMADMKLRGRSCLGRPRTRHIKEPVKPLTIENQSHKASL